MAQSSRAALTSTFEEPPLRDSMFRTLGAVSGGAAAAVAGTQLGFVYLRRVPTPTAVPRDARGVLIEVSTTRVASQSSRTHCIRE